MTRSALTLAIILGPTAILALMTLRAVRAGHVGAAVLWSVALAGWVLGLGAAEAWGWAVAARVVAR